MPVAVTSRPAPVGAAGEKQRGRPSSWSCTSSRNSAGPLLVAMPRPSSSDHPGDSPAVGRDGKGEAAASAAGKQTPTLEDAPRQGIEPIEARRAADL
jgi:hypothetical protein